MKRKQHIKNEIRLLTGVINRQKESMHPVIKQNMLRKVKRLLFLANKLKKDERGSVLIFPLVLIVFILIPVLCMILLGGEYIIVSKKVENALDGCVVAYQNTVRKNAEMDTQINDGAEVNCKNVFQTNLDTGLSKLLIYDPASTLLVSENADNTEVIVQTTGLQMKPIIGWVTFEWTIERTKKGDI